MKTRMTQITISLLILATQTFTTFSAERYEEKKDKSHNKSTLHQHKSKKNLHHHKSKKKTHRGYKPKPHKHKKPQQKPENPYGAGFHYCNSGHVNVGMGCQEAKGTCPEDPASPNYRYRE